MSDPVDAARAALRDAALRPTAQVAARDLAAVFMRHARRAQPPYQHIVPVLALGYAAAGCALLFGDPALIDLMAEEAQAALRRGDIGLPDLFATDPHRHDR